MCWRKKSEPFSKRLILCNQPHFLKVGFSLLGETINKSNNNNKKEEAIISLIERVSDSEK